MAANDGACDGKPKTDPAGLQIARDPSTRKKGANTSSKLFSRNTRAVIADLDLDMARGGLQREGGTACIAQRISP